MKLALKMIRISVACLVVSIFASCADDLQSSAKFSQGMDRCIFELAVKARINKHAEFADFAVKFNYKDRYIPKMKIESAEGFALENLSVGREIITPASKVFSFRRNSDLDCYIKLKVMPAAGDPVSIEIRWARKCAAPTLSVLNAPVGDLIQVKSYTKTSQPSFAETLWRPSSFR